MRSLRNFTFALVVTVSWVGTLPAQTTADIGVDFSSQDNPNDTPNGTYEYRTLSGVSLLGETSSYLGGPAGWQENGGPGGWTIGGLPGWSAKFYGHGPASVDWIAPASETLTISGGFFKPDIEEQALRPTLLLMKLNGQTISALMHFPADWDGASGEFNADNPKPFTLGVGGAEALSFGIQEGDRFTLTNSHWIMGDMTNSFCGFDLELTLDPRQSASVGTLYAARDAFDTSVSGAAESEPWSLLDGQDRLMVFDGSLFEGPSGWRSVSGAPPAWQMAVFPGRPDLGSGYLYCHAPDSGEPGVQLRWIAPAAGIAVIGGAVSRTDRADRDLRFRVEHNDDTITSVDMPDGVAIDPGDPIELFRMSGGSEALTIDVEEGDTIDFVTSTIKGSSSEV